MTLGDGSTFDPVPDRPFTHQDLIRHLWWLLDNRPQEHERSAGGEMIHDPTHPKTREEQDNELAQLAHRRMSLAAVAIIYFLLVAWAAYLVLPD